MGTSASNRGSGGASPLVPPWADLDNQGPGPESDSQRFRGFRTTLGRFVSGGDAGVGRSALGRFVSSGLGGSAIATRRFAPAISAGGKLSELVADLAQGGSGESVVGFDVSAFRGHETTVVIERIVDALCPTGTIDDEATRTALDEALSAVLSDRPEFDPDAMSLEMLEELLVKFTEEEIYLKVIAESGDAFDKVADPVILMDREIQLRELVRVVVDKDGRALLSETTKNFQKGTYDRVVRELFATVLRAFEDYVE
jgi:hypothetical protein